MIIIKLKDGESVEKGVKALKRKFDKIGIVKELRSRKEYKKPSTKRRDRKKESYHDPSLFEENRKIMEKEETHIVKEFKRLFQEELDKAAKHDYNEDWQKWVRSEKSKKRNKKIEEILNGNKKNKASLILKSLENQFINTGKWDDWWDDDSCGYWWSDYDYDYFSDEVYNRNKKIDEILGPDFTTTIGDFANGSRKK